MKKIFITAAFFAMSTFAIAQEDQQPSDDQLQQQAPRETQVQTERAAKREAKKAEREEKNQALNVEIKKDSVARKKIVESRSIPN